MTRLIVIILVVAGVAYFLLRGGEEGQQQVQEQQHAELTKMALQTEAKAKKAATLANKDQVAEFEKQDQQ